MILEEIIELTLYHAIREKLVIEGYLPDIMNFDVENSDAQIASDAVKSYKLAQKGIADTKGYCIEVFNFSSNQAKGLKKVPRIVIDVQSFLPGFLGNDTQVKYEYNNSSGYYERTTIESLKSDLIFLVYAVGNTANQMRIMNNIISQVLPKRGYIKHYEDEGLRAFGNFFVTLRDSQKDEDLAEGVMERILRFEIPDLDELGTIKLVGNIYPIKEIKVDAAIDNLNPENIIKIP